MPIQIQPMTLGGNQHGNQHGKSTADVLIESLYQTDEGGNQTNEGAISRHSSGMQREGNHPIQIQPTTSEGGQSAGAP